MEFGLKLLGEIIRKAKEMLERERERGLRPKRTLILSVPN
jgi:hypothetical protein